MLVKGKKKTGNRIGNRGLSIVEVVVAIAILSLVTVPLLQTFILKTIKFLDPVMLLLKATKLFIKNTLGILQSTLKHL